jgi:tetratricopeptide (TPR) repeat protein
VYNQALKSGLTQAEIYSSLGELYVQSGEQKNALNAYKQAVQAGETRIEVYKQLEQIYLAQNNTVAAEFLWETYALVNKQHHKALFQLVRHYQTHGEWLKAVTLSKELIANAPTNITYRAFLADLYEQKGMLGETKEQYRKILRIQPENQQAQQKLSKLGG